MRGLPPLPHEVLTFRATIETNGSPCDIVQYFFASGSIGWGYAEFGEFVTGWATFAMPHLLNCMPTASSFTTCRLSRVGSLPYTYVTRVAENNGSEGTAQSLNSALCLTWKTLIAGATSRSHNRLPLKADAVDNDKRRIDPDFWASIQLQAAQYVLEANSITIAGFSTPEFVVVSRSEFGSPRPSAVFSPVVSGEPSLWVGTLANRTQSRR